MAEPVTRFSLTRNLWAYLLSTTPGPHRDSGAVTVTALTPVPLQTISCLDGELRAQLGWEAEQVPQHHARGPQGSYHILLAWWEMTFD